MDITVTQEEKLITLTFEGNESVYQVRLSHDVSVALSRELVLSSRIPRQAPVHLVGPD